MQLSDLFILALATWYTAYVIVKLSGPANIFGWLRTKTAGGKDGSVGDALKCLYCTGFWVALAFVVIWYTPAQPIVYPFAVIGGGIILFRYTGGEHV